MLNDYARGWDDCLDIIESILSETTDIAVVKNKVEYVHILIKEKKFEDIKHQLGVLENVF